MYCRAKRIANGKAVEGELIKQFSLSEMRDMYFVRSGDIDYRVQPESVKIIPTYDVDSSE